MAQRAPSSYLVCKGAQQGAHVRAEEFKSNNALPSNVKQPLCDVSVFESNLRKGNVPDTRPNLHKDPEVSRTCCFPNKRKSNKNHDTKEDLVPNLAFEKTCTTGLLDLFNKAQYSEDKEIDLKTADIYIHSGIDVNAKDSRGETALHKAVRRWHLDVTRFLVINHKADVNASDNNGCAPLHVAAATNYTDMVEFLIRFGADKEARTTGDLHTPVFYAAKYNCNESLDILIVNGCQFDSIQDCKGRYPVQVAAEFDRSATARLLLERGARSWMDRSNVSGYGTIGWMIINMPVVAYTALDAYHTRDRTHRCQKFFLHQLMTAEKKKKCIDLPLQVAVNGHQYNMLCHRVFSKLIDYMWEKYARRRALIWFLINIIYIIIWSLLGVLVPYHEKHHYDLPSQWWRIVLWVVGVGLTVWQMAEEVLEYRQSIMKNNQWKGHRREEIDEDIKHCHDDWDKHFFLAELDELDRQRPRYFNDFWNVYDWVCYASLGVCFISHLIDVFHHSEDIARFHVNFMAFTIIILWLRLAKCARPFTQLGPLIVILAKMMQDFILFACLYLQFYLPFVCAYWMVFGGERITYDTRFNNENATEYVSVNGYADFHKVFFSLFRITLVDEYDYETMKVVDPVMADLLVGSWLSVSCIICFNLFIALLSDSFQRVYDNAHSIARMQKAIVCLVYWDDHSSRDKKLFVEAMNMHCNPLIEAYDDDDILEQNNDGDEMQKAVIQLREVVQNQQNNDTQRATKLHNDLNKVESTIEEIREMMHKLLAQKR